ncbi:hypothetical protein PVK06_017497 [Gossypium arboreum]|uniref:Uncharacterized protein n=1 Tax=Gossypium arboreum TaxID=29729 RepID=A0ABR0Q3J3_GOSAR|nr:hypothetical protein PVK06_017497 [Gossypium arboreum]
MASWFAKLVSWVLQLQVLQHKVMCLEVTYCASNNKASQLPSSWHLDFGGPEECQENTNPLVTAYALGRNSLDNTVWEAEDRTK